MLITFRTKAWSNITMFGDVALTLLKMMGHSGTVPGALLAAEIPAALAHLQRALNAVPEAGGRDNDPPAKHPDAAPVVGLQLRAHPLIQLLSAAARQECEVTWDKDRPAF